MSNPIDAKEAVERWDNGETIWSIEMGGLGPGYEQAIQLLFVEILRDHGQDVIPTDDEEFKKWVDSLDDTVHRLSHEGYSGAQVGAAKQLAYKFITDGWDKIMADESIKDRHIQISNYWPKAPQKIDTQVVL